MKKFLFFILFLTISSYGQNPSSTSSEIMKLSDVKPGMKGEAYTVFYGFKKEKFDVEILGIIKNMEPNKTTILARFKGENIEKSGVAQGMSGSPVYIDGKLIGAIAFTWGFLKEPLGGIQPIEQMLPVLETPKRDVLLQGKGNLFLEPVKSPPMIPVNKEKDNTLKKMGVPLIISGLDGEGFDYAKVGFAQKGFLVAQGMGGADAGAFTDDPKDKKSLKPGDSVAIVLMNGDASATAVGTVTYVDPKSPHRVLLFGHPFQGLGYVNFPMARSAVQYVMPISELPFKMATPTDIVGTIYNDRSTAVAGVLGKSPSMVPVDIKLLDQRQDQTHLFHYNIVPDPSFFSKLLSGAVISSYNRYNEFKNQTIHFEYNFYLKNIKTGKKDVVHISDYAIGTPEEIPKVISHYLDTPLTNLMFNFYNQAMVERVEVKLSYMQNLQVARLSEVIIPKNIVKPGETTQIRVVVETFQNKKEVVTIPFTVPYNYTGAVLPLTITGGQAEKMDYEKQYSGVSEPKSYEQLLQILSINDLSSNIVLYYDKKGVTANVDGYVLNDLPLSKAMDYGVKLQGNKYFGASRERVSYKTNYYIVGDLKTYIMIKDTKVKL